MSIKADLANEIYNREWEKHELRKKYFTEDNPLRYKKSVLYGDLDNPGGENMAELEEKVNKARESLKSNSVKIVNQNPSLTNDVIAELPYYEYTKVSTDVYVTRLPTGFKFESGCGSVFIKFEDFFKHTSLN